MSGSDHSNLQWSLPGWFDLKSTYLQDHKRKSNKQRLWKPKLQKLDLLGYGKLKSKEQTRTANSAKPKLQNLTFESSSRKNKPGLRKPKLQKPDLWKLKSKELQLTHSHLPHWQWTDAKAQAPKKKTDLWKLKSKELQLPPSHLPHHGIDSGLLQSPSSKNRATKDQVERTAAAPEHLPHWLYLAVL